MLLRFASVFLLLIQSFVVVAQEGDRQIDSRPLNLSLPRDVLWSKSAPAQMETARSALPALRAETARQIRMPYGSGYEVRQRAAWGADGGRMAGRGSTVGISGMGRRR